MERSCGRIPQPTVFAVVSHFHAVTVAAETRNSVRSAQHNIPRFVRYRIRYNPPQNIQKQWITRVIWIGLKVARKIAWHAHAFLYLSECLWVCIVYLLVFALEKRGRFSRARWLIRDNPFARKQKRWDCFARFRCGFRHSFTNKKTRVCAQACTKAETPLQM